MAGKIILAAVALFIAITIALNVAYSYGGLRTRARIGRLPDWFPLVGRVV